MSTSGWKKVQTKIITTSAANRNQNSEMEESGSIEAAKEGNEINPPLVKSSEGKDEDVIMNEDSNSNGDPSNENEESEPMAIDTEDEQKVSSNTVGELKTDAVVNDNSSQDGIGKVESAATKRKANSITEIPPSSSNDNVNENDSVASSMTSSPTKKHHFHDSDKEHSWYDPSQTSEDDVNTIDSNETSKFHKGNESKISLPKFTRYQMMTLLDQEQNQNFTSNLADEQDKSPSQRLICDAI